MKKFIAPALLALITLSSVARADEGQFGKELISASNEISSAIAQVPASEVDNTPTTPTTPSDDVWGGLTSGSEGESTGGAGGWDLNNDKKALPFYNSSSDLLYRGGTSMLRAQALKAMGPAFQNEAVITRTDACVLVRAALADLASANYLAGEPGSTQILKPFSARFKLVYDRIEANRPVYCNF